MAMPLRRPPPRVTVPRISSDQADEFEESAIDAASRARISRRRWLAAYVAVGMLVTAFLSAVLRYALGSPDALPLQNAASFLPFLALEASPPFLIILATSGRRIRSVAPVVLAGLLVFSFSNLAVGELFVRMVDITATRDVLLSLGAFTSMAGGEFRLGTASSPL